MAVTTGTITNCVNATAALGPKVDHSGNQIRTYLVTFSMTGTYAQANNSQILTVGAAMQAFVKNGKTFTLQSACMASPGKGSTAPGDFIGARSFSISSTSLLFELTDNTLVAEFADATLLTPWVDDIAAFVTVIES